MSATTTPEEDPSIGRPSKDQQPTDIYSTIQGVPPEFDAGGIWRKMRLWVAALALFALVFVASQTNASVSAESGSWSLRIDYAKVTRAGQPVPLEITLQSDVPITDPVVVRICATWFDSMDFQNWYPNPSSETRSGDTVEYEFDAPADNTLRVAFDGRAAPGQFGAILPCEIAVESAVATEGQPPLVTESKTWRLP